MRTIYKYKIEIQDRQIIEMPFHSQILHLEVVDGDVFLWAMVETDNHMVNVEFVTFATGQEIPNYALIKVKYVGTYVTHAKLDLFFVGHLFRF